jgi:hypothetical protein
MLVEQGPGVLVATNRFVESGTFAERSDVVRFEATISSPYGQVRRIYGVLTHVQGRIVRFLSGVITGLYGAVRLP